MHYAVQHISGTCSHNIFMCANVVILSLLHVHVTSACIRHVFITATCRCNISLQRDPCAWPPLRITCIWYIIINIFAAQYPKLKGTTKASTGPSEQECLKVIPHICIAHPFWHNLAHPCARAYWKHGKFPLILSSVSWKMAVAHQRAWAPHLVFQSL